MRKITIEPVTRIEGHAKVTLSVADDGHVESARLHIDEFRGFEKFVEGRPYFEMPQITARICGICPVSHHLAAAKACDAVAGATPPRPAALLRELMHMGQLIQSHGMHFFHLASPDLLLGFDADPATRNVVGLVQADPELAVRAIRLRAFGQDVIRRLGGKRIHTSFAVPGGVNSALTVEDRDEMRAGIDEAMVTFKLGISLVKRWFEEHDDLLSEFASFPSLYMGLVRDNGALEMYDGALRLIGRGGERIEEFDPRGYLSRIGERVEDWSYLKFPYYLPLGWPDGTYRVGPLARLNVADLIATPQANEEMKVFKAVNPNGPAEGSLWYHYARLIEGLYAVERASELLEDPDIISGEIQSDSREWVGEGVGCIEAPRGVLIHHYQVNERGMIEKANLIVATGHNNWAMSRSVEMVAKTFEEPITEGMLNRIEVAIRAYDPCLSCSTHALGSLPLRIEKIALDGTVIERFDRR